MNSLREKSQILTFEGQVTNHIKDRPSLTSMHCRVHLKTNCKAGTLGTRKKLAALYNENFTRQVVVRNLSPELAIQL